MGVRRLTDLPPGVYSWDGKKLRHLVDCDECSLSLRAKLLEIAQQVGDANLRQQLEDALHSGAGYD